MKDFHSLKKTAIQIAVNFFVAFFVFFTLFPLGVTILLSLKSPTDFDRGIWSLPTGLHFVNYSYSLSLINVNMLNSIACGLVVTLAAIFIASLASFVFARYEFPFKKILFSLIISLMMVPGILTLTSSYLNVQNLGLYNTRFAVILPGIASNLVGSFFLFYTFMGQQPKELFESAQVEGANSFQSYAQIAMPLFVPALMIQFVGIFAGQYNDYLWSMLVIEDTKKQMLMPLLKDMANELSVRHSNEGISYAIYICSGIPLIFTTAIGLKYCISGDIASGMKL